mgnify:CR=1 FL=1
MRGKVCIVCCAALVGRITPAHAGKRTASQCQRARPRDHPRACGEKCVVGVCIVLPKGSPPRMRGKVLAALMPENRVGITPAHAGKSGQFIRLRILHRDHPRACGEKNRHQCREYMAQGSPPRMRGKVCTIPSRALVIGITPAHAGKSLGFVRPSNTQ